MTIKDALGRELQEGDLVLPRELDMPLFRISSIVPVVDPRAPRDLVQVTLGCVVNLGAKAGTPHPQLLRIATIDETVGERGQVIVKES